MNILRPTKPTSANHLEDVTAFISLCHSRALGVAADIARSQQLGDAPAAQYALGQQNMIVWVIARLNELRAQPEAEVVPDIEEAKKEKLRATLTFGAGCAPLSDRLRLELSGDPAAEKDLPELNHVLSQIGFCETYPIGSRRYYALSGVDWHRAANALEAYGYHLTVKRIISKSDTAS